MIGLFVRLLICISCMGFVLYKSIDKMNELTELRLSIPLLKQEVKEIQEKNLELQYKIEQFESIPHLLELSKQPEFGHLKYPTRDAIIVLREYDSYQIKVDSNEK